MLLAFSLMVLLSLSPLVSLIFKSGTIVKLLDVICTLLCSVIFLVTLMSFPVYKVSALMLRSILRPMLRCCSVLLMVSVFSMLFRPRFVVIMTMTSISFLLLLVMLISIHVLWIVLILVLLLSRFVLLVLLVMLMETSLEMRERSGSHEQPCLPAPALPRRIELLDGCTLRAWS